MNDMNKLLAGKHIVDTVMLDDIIQGIEILIDGKEDNKKYIPIDEAFSIAEYIIKQIFFAQKKDETYLAETLGLLIDWREMLISQLENKDNDKNIDP